MFSMDDNVLRVVASGISVYLLSKEERSSVVQLAALIGCGERDTHRRY